MTGGRLARRVGALTAAVAALGAAGYGATVALGIGETTGTVTASVAPQTITIPGTSVIQTYTVPTVTGPTTTQTVTVTTTAPPPPPPPPPPPNFAPIPPAPPAPYAIPAGAISVSTSAALATALAGGSGRSIMLADGTYDRASYFTLNGNSLYAAHLGGATLTAGVQTGAGVSTIEGLRFAVTAPSKTLSDAAIHSWGSGVVRVLDTTLDGGDALGAGVKLRNADGVEVKRVVARHFRDWGVMVDDQQATAPSPTPLLFDLDVSNVSRPTPLSSNGQSEFGVWVGQKSIVSRVKTRATAWGGIMCVGNYNDGSTFSDLDVDGPNASGIAMYDEHYCLNARVSRFHFGPDLRRGVNCEWNNPAYRSAACIGVVYDGGTIDTTHVGVNLDMGTQATTIRNTRFLHQSCWAIDDYANAGNGNLYDTTGNDYSGIAPGAVPVSTSHLYDCPGAS